MSVFPEQVNEILPVVLSLSCDRSWRVRWSFSNGLHEICNAMGEDITNSSLVSVFQSLLGDVEPEVTSCDCMHSFSRLSAALLTFVMDTCCIGSSCFGVSYSRDNGVDANRQYR